MGGPEIGHNILGRELVPAAIGDTFGADWVSGPVWIDGGNPESVAVSSERSSVIGGLKAKASGEGLEHELVM